MKNLFKDVILLVILAISIFLFPSSIKIDRYSKVITESFECKSTDTVTAVSINLEEIVELLKYTETDRRNVIGDNGKARGILQIHKICVVEVNNFYNTRYTHNQMSVENLATEVAILYLKLGIKKFKKKYNKLPTEEQVVRMFNGGIYKGYRINATKKYYKRYLTYKSGKEVKKQF